MANKKLNAIITIGGAVSGTLIGSIDKTKSKLNDVGTALKNIESQQRKLGQAIQTFGQQGKNVDGMRTRYQALTKQVDQLRAANERLLAVEKARTANQEKQAQLRGKIGETAMVGAAIALPAFAAFGKSAQFNYDLQNIGNTANMTSAQIKQMGMDIVKTSDQTGQSTETIKNAYGFLIAAGQSVDQVNGNIRTIGRTSTAAAAEIEDVARASFVLGDALKIGEGQAMQDALDALVQSGKEGNFEFKAMAAELPVLGGAFQALKFTGQEAVASMGAYLQIARKGAATESEAANNFNNFLSKILSPDTLKKAEQLGGNLYGVVSDAQAAGKNPIDAAIAEINRITQGGDQKLLGELFADMQVQNFVRPALQNLKEYEDIKAKAMNSRGVVDKDFATMMDTDKLAIENLSNAFGGLVKTIGDAVGPAIKSVAVVLTPVLRAVRDFVAANPNLVGGLIVAAGAFTALRLAALGTRLAFSMMGGSVLDLAAKFARQRVEALMASAAITAAGTSASTAGAGAAAGSTGFMTLATRAIPAVTTAVRAMGVALVSSPIGAVVAGIAFGAVQIYRHWQGISAFFGGIGEGLSSGLQPVVQVFRDFYNSLTILHPAFNAVGSVLSSAWQWFSSLLDPVKYTSDELASAGAAGKSFGEALAAGVSFVLTPLQLLIQGITWINTNIGAALEKAVQFKNAVGNGIGGAWNSTKEFFGLGGGENAAPAIGSTVQGESTPPAATSAAAPALPQPTMATARGNGPVVTDSSQNTFNIYQQPGQDNRKLAEEIARKQQERQQVMQRGALYDGAMTQ